MHLRFSPTVAVGFWAPMQLLVYGWFWRQKSLELLARVRLYESFVFLSEVIAQCRNVVRDKLKPETLGKLSQLSEKSTKCNLEKERNEITIWKQLDKRCLKPQSINDDHVGLVMYKARKIPEERNRHCIGLAMKSEIEMWTCTAWEDVSVEAMHREVWKRWNDRRASHRKEYGLR